MKESNRKKRARRFTPTRYQKRAPSKDDSIPSEVIEAAVRRATAPRSLTAILMGDPPAGFSALERRA
jgi:hypothetical protein